MMWQSGNEVQESFILVSAGKRRRDREVISEPTLNKENKPFIQSFERHKKEEASKFSGSEVEDNFKEQQEDMWQDPRHQIREEWGEAETQAVVRWQKTLETLQAVCFYSRTVNLNCIFKSLHLKVITLALVWKMNLGNQTGS